MKDCLWLGYYYLGGGLHPLTGGRKWVLGRVEGYDPLCDGSKDTLTLGAREKLLRRKTSTNKSGERLDRWW